MRCVSDVGTHGAFMTTFLNATGEPLTNSVQKLQLCACCTQVVRHADYPVAHFTAMAAALSPAAVYCAQQQAPHLCQMPSLIMGSRPDECA